jgi:uncharacterized membrane protein HdeD (DUF308 family)
MEVRAMSQQLKAMMRQGTPWRRGIPWWLVIAEGVVAVAAGIAMLVQPQETASLIVIVFVGYLLVNGLLRIYAGIKTQSRGEGFRPMTLVSGGIGLVVGLLVITQPLPQYLDTAGAITILATGLLLIGIIGLYDAIAARSGRWGAMLASGLHILLGVLLLYARSDPSVTNWLGITALVIGALLVAYGLILHRSASRPAKAAREPTLGNG